MELNLFSSFDPNSGMFSLNYFILILFIIFPSKYWYYMSRYMIMLYNMMKLMNKEFLTLVGLKISGGLLLYITLFFFILQFNILGMYPYIFTMTGQLNMNLFFSFGFFYLFFCIGWLKMSKKMFSHLTPMGSPMILSPFLVLIELISLMIRPLTLSVRLTANIISGHILMDIMLSPVNLMNFPYFLFFYFFVLPILLLEIIVCFVQSFVISSLSSMYLGEPLSH